MAKFNRGEICIGQNFVESPEYNGKECEIAEVHCTEGLGVNLINLTTIKLYCPYYRVKFCGDADMVYVNEFNLRRKPPQRKDMDRKTEWENGVWTPHEVTA